MALRRAVLALSLTTLIACGGDDDSGPSATPPAAPAENDDAFTVERIRDWYLVGNAVTPGQDQLEVQVTAPAGVDIVDMWIDGQPGVRLADTGSDFRLAVDISAVAAGAREVLFAADGSATAFARVTFNRSHPLYVVVSNDWDDPDNSDAVLTLQEELHAEHAELRLTHFVGPYTFTDPEVTSERAAYLVTWVKGLRDTYDDEIGLHIHPYCSFVETTDVPCRIEPSFAYTTDPSGYTVLLNSYTEAELTTLVAAADALFEANGLDKATAFRAGGWIADLMVLRVLAANGYVADTSANNWARLEEWEGDLNGVLYDWNQTNWSSIGDTSQPYYPSASDILVPGDPDLAILEVPDNGSLVDYVSGAEMIDIFDANWDGGPLDAPIAYSIGYHPSNFNTSYKERITEALTYVDQFLVSYDHGPVIYATLSEMALVWPHD